MASDDMSYNAILQHKPSRVKTELSSAPNWMMCRRSRFDGRPSGSDLELAHGFPFRRHLLAQFPALIAFTVKRLRHRRRTAHFAEQQHFHLKLAALVGHAQSVAYPHFARRLGGLPVR
jgi:hypothetical protein